MAKRPLTWPLTTLIIGLYLFVVALPSGMKSWMPNFLQPTLHLGLDLQGGTQLDFRISESQMREQIERLGQEITELEHTNAPPEAIADTRAQITNVKELQRNIVEAIRTVLERRVNSLGVSEAVITPSYYGDEKHLLVECPGVIDVQQCIDTVGKTILLEFKEENRGEDESNVSRMRALAEDAYARITESGETLTTVGQDLAPTLGVFFAEDSFFQEDLPTGLAKLWNRSSTDPILFEEVELDPIPTDGEPLKNRGIILAQVTGEKEEAERVFTDPIEGIASLAESNDNLVLNTHEDVPLDQLNAAMKEALTDIRPGILAKSARADGTPTITFITDAQQETELIEVSHILIAYEGAVRADHTVTRTIKEAQELAKDLLLKIDTEGSGFNRLAKDHSDAPSAEEGGSLGQISRGQMSAAFEEAAFALQQGDISDPIETEFGFHIIRADSDITKQEGSVSFLELAILGEHAEEVQEQVLTQLELRQVAESQEQLPVRTLFFSFLPTGWKDTPLDGKHFQRATVNSDPLTGVPVVQIIFDSEGGDLFYELTKRNTGKPIAIFVGGELVSAPVVQSEIPGGIAIITGSQNFDEANRLAQDLNTGAIPAPIHLVGQVTVEASLGKVALQTSIRAALIGFLLVGIYMIWYYRILGVIATIALTVYATIFAALLKLPVFLFTDQYVVLTLAGVAGIILSIGMAVDANVLIFERMKEELRKGKLLQTAADTGFKRAWSSIRDSNISTLLTALILFIIGSSIVRGFAVTLSMGILISLFTAVVVTRFLIRLLQKSPIANNRAAFGV